MAQRRGGPPRQNILREISPLLSTGGMIAAVIIWCFNTFAQISYVKETQAQLSKQIEDNQKAAIEHSDQNRQRMEALMNQMNETLKLIEQRTYRQEQKYIERINQQKP